MYVPARGALSTSQIACSLIGLALGTQRMYTRVHESWDLRASASPRGQTNVEEASPGAGPLLLFLQSSTMAPEAWRILDDLDMLEADVPRLLGPQPHRRGRTLAAAGRYTATDSGSKALKGSAIGSLTTSPHAGIVAPRLPPKVTSHSKSCCTASLLVRAVMVTYPISMGADRVRLVAIHPGVLPSVARALSERRLGVMRQSRRRSLGIGGRGCVGGSSA